MYGLQQMIRQRLRICMQTQLMFLPLFFVYESIGTMALSVYWGKPLEVHLIYFNVFFRQILRKWMGITG